LPVEPADKTVVETTPAPSVPIAEAVEPTNAETSTTETDKLVEGVQGLNIVEQPKKDT
jgi:hypothetical protein